MSDTVWAHVVFEGVDYLVPTKNKENVRKFIIDTTIHAKISRSDYFSHFEFILKDKYGKPVEETRLMENVPGGSCKEIPLYLVRKSEKK
jgi:hypothetical protein